MAEVDLALRPSRTMNSTIAKSVRSAPFWSEKMCPIEGEVARSRLRRLLLIERAGHLTDPMSITWRTPSSARQA